MSRSIFGYVSSQTTNTVPVSPQTLSVDYLLVGGGGGGGYGRSASGAGAGGGAGGMRTVTGELIAE